MYRAGNATSCSQVYHDTSLGVYSWINLFVLRKITFILSHFPRVAEAMQRVSWNSQLRFNRLTGASKVSYNAGNVNVWRVCVFFLFPQAIMFNSRQSRGLVFLGHSHKG